jgi:hypothetical protein
VTTAAGVRVVFAAFGLAAGLAACTKASTDDASPPPAAATAADHFGPGFAQAFRASPDSAPINPSTTRVISVDPNGTPVQIK